MADITITAGNVVAGSGASIKHGTAGATITAGQVLYLDAADDQLKLVDNDGATTDEVVGIALHGASDSQPLAYLSGGQITIGGTVVVGTVYTSSSTAGGIAPVTDNATGDYVSVIGVGISATVILVKIINSGVQVP